MKATLSVPRASLALLPLLTALALFLAALGMGGALSARLLSGVWVSRTQTATLVAFSLSNLADLASSGSEAPESATPKNKTLPSKTAHRKTTHQSAARHRATSPNVPNPVLASPETRLGEIREKLSRLPGVRNIERLRPERLQALFAAWGAPWPGTLPLVFELVDGTNANFPDNRLSFNRPSLLKERIQALFPEALVISPPPQTLALPNALVPFTRLAWLAGAAVTGCALLLGCVAALLAARLGCLQTRDDRKLFENLGSVPTSLAARVGGRAFAGAASGAIGGVYAVCIGVHTLPPLHQLLSGTWLAQCLVIFPPRALLALGCMIFLPAFSGWGAARFYLSLEKPKRS